MDSSHVIPMNYFSTEQKDPFRDVISQVSERYRHAVEENKCEPIPEDLLGTETDDPHKPGHYRKISTYTKTRPVKDGEIQEEATKFKVRIPRFLLFPPF